MTAVILFSLLFIVVVCGILFFLFYLLIPSLREQQVNAVDPLFSKEEIEFNTGHPNFQQANTGMRAIVLCSPDRSFPEKRFIYKGRQDCSLFKSLYSTENGCSWGCSGFGNCIYACPRQAISVENGTAVVNSLCNGCGLCISVCPKQLITLIPADSKTCVMCKAPRDEKNGCSMCGKESRIHISETKHFLLWKKWYKIMHRK